MWTTAVSYGGLGRAVIIGAALVVLVLPPVVVSLATDTPAASAAVPTEAIALVVCAPGYPGNTEDAQPAMDALAGTVAEAAGWAGTRLTATYHPTVAAGRTQLAETASALALVPFSFYWAHGDGLRLRPLLQVERDHGTTDTWSLVARRGRVTRPADLLDWEITGLPAHAPGYVHGPVLSHWGALPGSTRITFTARILAALRRAAAGDDVAVLLDRAQHTAVAALPFGDDLEVVTQSPELPGFVLCVVDGRLEDEDVHALQRGLVALHKNKEGREILASIRMVRFRPLDEQALSRHVPLPAENTDR